MNLHKTFEKIYKGKNFIEIRPSFWRRFLKQKSYMVLDVQDDDGNYLLDRYFIRHEVRVMYPHDGDYVHPLFPACVIYDIAFAESDQSKVDAALKDLYDQSRIFDWGESYDQACEFFQHIAYDSVGAIAKEERKGQL